MLDIHAQRPSCHYDYSATDARSPSRLSLPRPTFAISNISAASPTPSPLARSNNQRHDHNNTRSYWPSQLRANMSSCLNLRRATAGDKLIAATGSGAAASPGPSPRSQPQTRPQDTDNNNMCEIGMPYDLKHDVHVHYNFQEARFEGVSPSFAEYLATSSELLLGAKCVVSASAASAAASALSMFARTSTRVKRSRTASASLASTSTPLPTPHTTTFHVQSTTTHAFHDPACPTDPTDPLVLLNQHFQVHFRQVPRRAVIGYSERIPAVLVMLHEHFCAKNGADAPHIFRESPNKEERDRAIREINSGTFHGAQHDVRVLADLIKLWFRELPVPIFHEIRADAMEQLVVAGGDVAAAVLERLGPLEQCILLWLADALARVAVKQTVNHMGVEQLAIVIAPNLVRIETANPMLAVALSKASVDLFRAVLRARFDALKREIVEDDASAAAEAEKTNDNQVEEEDNDDNDDDEATDDEAMTRGDDDDDEEDERDGRKESNCSS